MSVQAGEIVVARLSGGLSVRRCLETTPKRVRLSVGRNRQAELPSERVVLATGVIASGEDEVEQFRQRCEELAAEIDLAEVWEVVRDEGAPMALEEISELYWDRTDDALHRAAVLLHLDRSQLYFDADKDAYAARSRQAVEETQAQQRRKAEHAQASESLMANLTRGRLPEAPSEYQSTLVEHLRGFAVHGDDYTRSAVARGLLTEVAGQSRDLQRLGFDLLVGAGVLSPDEPLELERAGVPRAFPADVLSEADAIDPKGALADPRRRDLTAMPTVTIDDSETQDRDDALSLEVEEQRVYRIGIHITAAGTVMPRDGALDREAARRMASIYMPDGKIGMLPPRASNEIGSLAAGEERAALSVLVRVTEAGEVLDWEVTPSVVRSEAALSYAEADEIIAEEGRRLHGTLFPLHRIATALRAAREVSGAITIERPEMRITIDDGGRVDVSVQPRSTPSRSMVAEFMILANSLFAEFCHREGIPAPYRSQAVPDLDEAMQAPEGPLRSYLTMRRLTPAGLDTTPSPHGGLGVTKYTQATSPLRRYLDLTVQRQIDRFLDSGEAPYSTDEIATLAQQAEVQLRELGRLEEERRRYWFLKYLAGVREGPEGGDLFEAVVLEVRPNRPVLVELVGYPFRFRTQLPADSYPGQQVTLRLHGVDLWRRLPQFTAV